MYNRWMAHSAKGTTWHKKNAKYIKKLPDGTYLYEQNSKGLFDSTSKGTIAYDNNGKNARVRESTGPDAMVVKTPHGVASTLGKDVKTTVYGKKKRNDHYDNYQTYEAKNIGILHQTYRKWKSTISKQIDNGRKWLNKFLFGLGK